jgi:hypothetical protein
MAGAAIRIHRRSTERRSTPAKGDTRKENILGRFLGGDADDTLSLSTH